MKKMFQRLYLFLLILIPGTCLCQTSENSDIRDITKVTFFNPGISYEKRIGNYQSLYGQIFINTSFFLGYSDAMGFTSGIHFDPAATLQYRYYYNAMAREAKEKRIEMNNLNYVSFILTTTLIAEKIKLVDYTEKNHRDLKELGIAWGFQRNYKSRFSLDLNAGIGCFFTKSLTIGTGGLVTESIVKFTTLGQVNLGFWLNKITLAKAH